MSQENNSTKDSSSDSLNSNIHPSSSTDSFNDSSNGEQNTSENPMSGFCAMNLAKPVLRALKDIGYETPTSIQSLIIPHVLAGKDVVGQAQTGTGKTAAFALPLLSRIDLKKKNPQVLVITPTRELAIQVAESFKEYASRMKEFHVLPIYGGQSYDVQLKQLKRGVHVVVGTPGRLMDHINRGTLNLGELICVVLDEADEMLRMGFIDDVKWILEQTPESRQMALFSATMPPAIRSIARRYLNEPKEVTIQVKTVTADTIRQRFWMVKGTDKLEALTRILDAEDFDAIIVFVRTKTATVELAEKLEARGYATEPLNGDIAQKSRERTIERLKNGKIDIVVATDVAARGLDVDRISHVINYDIPTEAESYIHRIGRTGRAGRNGDAILFVSPREMWMLKVIEKTTHQKLEMMNLPTTRAITNKRIAAFKQRISDTLASEEISAFRELMDEYRQAYDVPALDIAAALAIMVNGDKPLFPVSEKNSEDDIVPADRREAETQSQKRRTGRREEQGDSGRNKKKKYDSPSSKNDHSANRSDANAKRGKKETRTGEKNVHKTAPVSKGMERFSLDVGQVHGVRAADIVGAISNEAGLDGKFISNVTIHEDHSTVDLPEGMPDTVFKILKKVRVTGRKLNINKI